MECRCTFCRHINTNNIWLSCRQICLNLFLAQMQTVLVIYYDLCSSLCHFSFQRFQSFFVTETVISISLLDQLFCIFQIQSHLLSLALHIWTDSAVFVRTFIVNQSCLFQSAVYNLKCTLDKTFLICILDTKKKIAVFMFCDQICI